MLFLYIGLAVSPVLQISNIIISRHWTNVILSEPTKEMEILNKTGSILMLIVLPFFLFVDVQFGRLFRRFIKIYNMRFGKARLVSAFLYFQFTMILILILNLTAQNIYQLVLDFGGEDIFNFQANIMYLINWYLFQTIASFSGIIFLGTVIFLAPPKQPLSTEYE